MHLTYRQLWLIMPLVQLYPANLSLASSDENSALILGVLPIAAFAGILIGGLVVARLVCKNTWRTTTLHRTALQASEERYRLVTERSADLIALTDDGGYIRYASPSFASTLGYDPRLATGRRVFDRVHPDDIAETMARFDRTWREGRGEAVVRLRHADGTWRWIEARSELMIENSCPAVLIVGRDISEQKRLEADLIHLYRLDSVGHMASVVIHDVNNLLTGIGGIATLGLQMLPSDQRCGTT